LSGLVEDRDLFTYCLSRLRVTIQVERTSEKSPFYGLMFAGDESRVFSPRKVRKAGMTFWADDAVHMKNSLHHEGCASDFIFWAQLPGGKWDPVPGTHPAYKRLADIWRALHPRATPGDDFGDPGHVSITRGGRR
jgi:hypothetical protein